MLSIKIFSKKKDRGSIFNRTMSNIAGFIKKNINGNLSIISDNNSFEIVSGETKIKDDDIVTELLIKKTICKL